MRALLLAVIAALALAACDAAGEDERPDGGSGPGSPAAGGPLRDAGDGRITAEGLDRHLRALQRIADRNDGNRAAGTDGFRESAEYVAGVLRGLGWRVRLQDVGFPFFEERSPPRLALAGGRRFRAGRDFRTMAYSGSGDGTGPVRRPASTGCSDADFEQLVRGAVALVKVGDGCFLRDKVLHAQAAGALGVVAIDPGGGRVSYATLLRPGPRIPALLVSTATAQRLEDGARVAIRVDAVSERRVTRNVLAETTGGSDRRVVMAGGHLDSVPAGPGLNDNGSGVAALLEIADALGGREREARVRLGFWGAEELGLVGSRRYVRALPRAQRRRIDGYVNLDMVGSPNPMRLVYDVEGLPGPDASPEAIRIERLLRRILGPPVEGAPVGGSDDLPFHFAGIAVGGIFTGADDRMSLEQARRFEGRPGRPSDPCYHRACDTIGNVNRDVLLEMARAAGKALDRLAARAPASN